MKNRMVSMSPIKYSLLLLCLMISCTLSAQTSSGFISGKVYEIYQGKHEPSIGVNVSIENNQRRVLTGVTCTGRCRYDRILFYRYGDATYCLYRPKDDDGGYGGFFSGIE